MESPSSYTIPNVRVVGCQEHFTDVYKAGWGKDAVFSKVSLGWFLLLEGSHEALYLGRDQPALASGDCVSITIQKEPNGIKGTV